MGKFTHTCDMGKFTHICIRWANLGPRTVYALSTNSSATFAGATPMRETLPSAALRYCGEVAKFMEPIAVLRGLDETLRGIRSVEAINVFGVWYWPSTAPNDVERWVDGKTVFMLASKDLIADYLAIVRVRGVAPTTLLARRKSAPFTLTEAMREVRPTGNGRWIITLLRNHGIRDCLYCPYTRWTLAYSSHQPIRIASEARSLLGMAATAAVGRIEKLKHFPAMATKVQLSPRELEILQLLSTGLTGNIVGKELGLSARTVHRHIANICKKLGAKNTAHAVAEAIRQGLII